MYTTSIVLFFVTSCTKSSILAKWLKSTSYITNHLESLENIFFNTFRHSVYVFTVLEWQDFFFISDRTANRRYAFRTELKAYSVIEWYVRTSRLFRARVAHKSSFRLGRNVPGVFRSSCIRNRYVHIFMKTIDVVHSVYKRWYFHSDVQ